MNWPTHHSRVLGYIHLVRLIELTPETKYNYVVVVVFIQLVCCVTLFCMKIYIMICKFSVRTSSNTLQFYLTY